MVADVVCPLGRGRIPRASSSLESLQVLPGLTGLLASGFTALTSLGNLGPLNCRIVGDEGCSALGKPPFRGEGRAPGRGRRLDSCLTGNCGGGRTGRRVGLADGDGVYASRS